jgi:hypothetical protein
MDTTSDGVHTSAGGPPTYPSDDALATSAQAAGLVYDKRVLPSRARQIAMTRLLDELIRTLLDPRQPRAARCDVLKRVRWMAGDSGGLSTMKAAVMSVALADPDPELRLEATAALADFVDDINVRAALGTIIGDTSVPLELRYVALTSLDRGGPLPAFMALLESLRFDEELGKTALGMLSRWQARLRRESSRPQR